MLDKMTTLEWLEMHYYLGNPCHLENYEPLCRLSQLKHLSTDLSVSDDSVEAITWRCKKLQSLELCNCEYLTLQSLETICCNAGERLTEFGVYRFCYLRDDNVVECIRSCPKLTLLFVGGMCGITPKLPELVSAVRQEVSPGNVLRLDLSDFELFDGYYRENQKRV